MVPKDHLMVAVCHISALPLGMGRAFQIGANRIALFRTRTGKVFATAQECPHRRGPLADGILIADQQVVCPLHAYRFDLLTGQCEQPGVCSVRVYPVEVTPEGQVFVGIPRAGHLQPASVGPKSA
jgi:nitrite reductase (NADH) small subunit